MKILFLIIFVIGLGVFVNQAFADHTEVIVTVPSGAGTPGCEETAEGCYIPKAVTVDVGGKIIFSNTDTAAHTFTAGTPADGPTGEFDSGLVMAGATFETTLEKEGTVNYFCMVHPWMTGIIVVEASEDSFSLDAAGTAKLSKAVTKGAYKFNKGTYTVTVNISADIDSVNSKGIPKLSNTLGTYTIDGSNDSQDVTDKSFTNLKLTVNKNLKSIKWSSKEGSGEFKFTSKLDFDAKIDKTGKGSTAKVTAGKGTFSPKVSSSGITFD